jgi:hypothetical protein
VLSLALHLLGWGAYELNLRTGWFERWPVFARLHQMLKLVPPPLPPLPREQTEPQLAFVQVTEADPVAPAKPKFYSNNNSHAANPDADQNLDHPKINGQQTDVPQVETAHRTQLAKTPPTPEAPPTPEQPRPAQPQPTLKAGDLDTGKPQDAPPQPQEQLPPRPPRLRTLKEVRAQQHLAGVEMHQEGGVSRHASMASFDAIATPFGEYDAEFTQAVKQKWYDLLDSQNFAGDCVGRVTLHFHLNYDGTITDVSMVDRSVDMHYAYLCQQALTEPAPFAKWPEEMRREIGGNRRDMTFTFFYY